MNSKTSDKVIDPKSYPGNPERWPVLRRTDGKTIDGDPAKWPVLRRTDGSPIESPAPEIVK